MTRRVPRGYVALIIGYIIIGAAILTLFGVGAIRLSTSTGGTQTQPMTIFLFNASDIELSPTGTLNEVHQFSISNTSVVEGSFVSTKGVQMYVVPAGGLSNYSKFYSFTTGNVTSGQIFVTLAPGSYYFIITNPVQSSTSITITRNIVVVPLGSISRTQAGTG